MAATSGGSYASYSLPGQRGSAYLNPEFVEGLIVLKDGSEKKDKLMRYNLYTQQMQFIENEDTLALGNPHEIEYISLDDKVFVYSDFICSGKHKSGYFELLESGDCRLLKRWFALYQEVDNTVDGNNECDIFYRDCQCFLQFFMNPATPVLEKKKDFVMSFANNGDEVKDFMKQDKLKPKNEDDLMKIVAYYNGISPTK